jgi:tetratricopeptide (TPR) repeat protein
VLRCNWAEAKAAAGAVREAVQTFTALIEERPDDAGVYVAMAKVFIDQGWFADAENALRMARQFGADSLDLLNQEGIVHREQYRYAEAVACFEAGLAVEPDNAPLHVNLANALAWLRRDEAAATAYRQALALNPNDVEAQFSYACFLLMRGRTDPGWQYYESRWQRGDRARTRRPQSGLPQWRGEATDPRTDSLLVFSEQGFGDNIQFVRLLERIRSKFARIVLVTRPALLTLFSRALTGIAEVVTERPDETTFRWQLPLVSIGQAMHLPVAEWTMSVPYLGPDAAAALRWQSHLPTTGQRRVGLCWSGGKLPRYRHRFDLPLDAVHSLLACAGVSWVGLQQSGFEDWRAEQVGQGRLFDPMPQVDDFDDTAALIENLDLVISTDTAVAHLAGAMGKPVWLLLSSEGEWRWLQDRADTPWYPGMRIFRQEVAGDWSSVCRAVRDALGRQPAASFKSV